MEHRKPKMKDFLAESLELLMQEKPFDKITIKQICDRAGVIRATFYNHFEDKYAALDYIADELLHEEQKVFVASKDIVHVILSLCETIYDHRAFFQRAFQVQGQNDFDNMFTRHIAQLIEELLGGVRDDDAMASLYSNEALSLYFANAFMYLCGMAGGLSHTAGVCGYSSGLLLHGLRDYLGKKCKNKYLKR
ncbi:MAG: TetR family transcriptional regulator [Merdibacter sp.]